MRRLSDIAFICYADITEHQNALLCAIDGLYIDHYRLAELKRQRIRQFYHENWKYTENTETQ